MIQIYKGTIFAYTIKKAGDDILFKFTIYYHLQWFKFKVIEVEQNSDSIDLKDLIKAMKTIIDEMNKKFRK